MAHTVCIVQEGQLPDRRRAELVAGLRRIGREHFDDADGTDAEDVGWIRVGEGFGFTAGSPSTSTLVARSVPVGLEQAPREAFMTAVCDLWVEVTGCSRNEIVVTAMDGPLPI